MKYLSAPNTGNAIYGLYAYCLYFELKDGRIYGKSVGKYTPSEIAFPKHWKDGKSLIRIR